MRTVNGFDARVFQVTSVIALALSFVFQFLIMKAYVNGDKWRVVLDFNATGEGFLELLIVFPLCILFSSLAFARASEF